MFESVENYVNELNNSVDYTKGFIKKLSGGRTRLANSIAKSEEAVKTVANETKYVANLKPTISKLALQGAKDILFANAKQAIRTNYEFDAAPYRLGLFEAIENNDTYRINTRGSGFSTVMTVDINLDKTAGRLNIWGSAIKKARQELGVKVPRKTKNITKELENNVLALRASRAWAKIFDRRSGTFSKFSKTVRLRLSFSTKPAPFWQLLDKGEVPLSSDRGGYPTPKNTSTNFVNESEQTTKDYISNLFLKEEEKYRELTSSYNTVLDGAKTRLAELDSLVDEIRLDQKQIQNLNTKADRVLRANYDTKLEKAVQLIREGLISTKSLELASKGSYRGKRFSMETIRELLI